MRTPLLWGLGATETSFAYAHQYLKIILIGSVFQMLGMGILPLLKNSNKVKIAAAASLLSVFTNLSLDYVFIYVANLDLAGAALASVLAQVISFMVCILAYFKEFKGITMKKKFLLIWLRQVLLHLFYPFLILLSSL